MIPIPTYVKKNRWIVHLRLINETLTIDTSSCATEQDPLMTVTVTRGIYDILSLRTCSHHIECPSAVCLPIARLIRDLESTYRENEIVRKINRFIQEKGDKGVCVPWYVIWHIDWFVVLILFPLTLQKCSYLTTPSYSTQRNSST